MSAEMDRIGLWSEVKLAIIREYMPVYSKLVSDYNLRQIYIDGFAGFGMHESKSSGEIIPGSPVNALNTEPPFKRISFHRPESRKSKAAPYVCAWPERCPHS